MATVQSEVVIAAPPSKIWSLLGDVTTWESWNPKVKNGRMLDGDEFFPGATFQFMLDGKPAVGTITLVERPKSLSWRWGNTRAAFRLQPEGQTTRVSATSEVSGFMANLRKAKSEAEARESLQGWLNSLKQGAEGRSA